MEEDRVRVQSNWAGGNHALSVSLATGDAEMRRQLRAKGFRGELRVTLSHKELTQLRARAAEVQASDQELGRYDFWARGNERVEVWRAGEHVVVKNDGGHVAGAARALADLAFALVERYLPVAPESG